MKKILTGALAALTLGGALAASAVPAAAYPYRGGYGGWHGGYRGPGWGGVAAAGIVGLAAGAAIANSYPPVYYGPRCRIEMRWDPAWGGYERVRVCY
jgi:hypothetical protein